MFDENDAIGTMEKSRVWLKDEKEPGFHLPSFHSSFLIPHSSFQSVLRAAQESGDIGAVHVDDKGAAQKRRRQKGRERLD